MNSIIKIDQDPSAERVILFLIKEELKSRKFFEDLRSLGVDSFFYQAELTELIMLAMGFKPESSIQRNVCDVILDQHSQRIVENITELLDEAQRAYNTLLKHAMIYGKNTTINTSNV